MTCICLFPSYLINKLLIIQAKNSQFSDKCQISNPKPEFFSLTGMDNLGQPKY